jgi:hypothetical protein
MIGLVIVIILLAIGLVFYFKFSLSNNSDSAEDTTLDVAYLTNLMQSISNVKICEGTLKVEDAFVACFESAEICGQEACNYAKNEIKDIIGVVGLKKYKKYSIWVEKGKESKNIVNDCKTGILSSITVKTHDNGTYKAYFRVC